MAINVVETSADILYFSDGEGRKIGRAPDGTLWCCYLDSVGGLQSIHVMKSTNDGGTWTSDTTITDTIGADDYDTPSLCIDSSGNVHIAAVFGNALVYNERLAGVWQAEVVIDATIQGGSTPIAVNSANDVVILCVKMPVATNQIACYRTVAGAWQAVEYVSTAAAGKHQYHPAVVIDASNTIHALWYGTGYGVNSTKYQIIYNSYSGGAWGTNTNISDYATHQTMGQIALDSSGNVWAVWTQVNATPTAHILRYREKTTSWQTEGNLAINWVNASKTYCSISVDQSDVVYLVYRALDVSSIQQGYYRTLISGSLGSETLFTNNSIAGNSMGELITVFAKHPSSNIPLSGFGCLFYVGVGVADYEVRYYVARWAPYTSTDCWSEPCYDIMPTGWKKIDFRISNDGTYRYLWLNEMESELYRIRMIGETPFSSLSAITDTIPISASGATDVLVSYAAYLLYEMTANPQSSEELSRYESKKAEFYGRYNRLLRKFRMPTPAGTLHIRT